MSNLIQEIQPGLAASEAAFMVALMDFDDDGRIYLEDVQVSGEECFEAAAEVSAGPSSELVPALQVWNVGVWMMEVGPAMSWCQYCRYGLWGCGSWGCAQQ